MRRDIMKMRMRRMMTMTMTITMVMRWIVKQQCQWTSSQVPQPTCFQKQVGWGTWPVEVKPWPSRKLSVEAENTKWQINDDPALVTLIMMRRWRESWCLVVWRDINDDTNIDNDDEQFEHGDMFQMNKTTSGKSQSPPQLYQHLTKPSNAFKGNILSTLTVMINWSCSDMMITSQELGSISARVLINQSVRACE